jgi:hypothetical protein
MRAVADLRFKLFTLLATLWACGLSVAQEKETRLIADVNIIGYHRKPTQDILPPLRTLVGDIYNPALIQEDVRSLSARDEFANVQARFKERPDGKIEILFMVTPIPSVIEDIEYRGRHALTASELNSVIVLKKGEEVHPKNSQAACTRIVQLYNEKGRPFATCALLEGNASGDSRVVFAIEEGPEVKLEGVQFAGNSYVSGPVLRQHVKVKPGLYIPSAIEKLADKLRVYYRSFGFHDVKVATEIRWNSENTRVTVVYHIEEGQRYRKDHQPEKDAAKVSEEELQRIIQIRADDCSGLPHIDDYIGGSHNCKVLDREVYVEPEDSSKQSHVLSQEPNQTQPTRIDILQALDPGWCDREPANLIYFSDLEVRSQWQDAPASEESKGFGIWSHQGEGLSRSDGGVLFPATLEAIDNPLCIMRQPLVRRDQLYALRALFCPSALRQLSRTSTNQSALAPEVPQSGIVQAHVCTIWLGSGSCRAQDLYAETTIDLGFVNLLMSQSWAALVGGDRIASEMLLGQAQFHDPDGVASHPLLPKIHVLSNALLKTEK